MPEKKSTSTSSSSTAEQANGGSDLGRASYLALQARNAVTIFAFGVHPTPGYTDFFKQLPIRIFPPQFSFHSIPPGGMVPQVLTPFSIWVMFGASEPIETVTVHDAGGAHEIEVEQPSKALAEAEQRETWISGSVVREGAAARFLQPTTMATGEEGGGPTTMATGEEDARIATTLAVGEEDPPMTTMALGEEGATTLRLGEEGPTTLALGEEGQTTFGLTATTLAVGEEDPTTLALGEEDPTTRAVGEEGPTTMALGEESGGPFVQNSPFGSF
ncbi:MAG TPA: hypothetical protein VJT15_19575 [Pyrinomonadaceae bacterium]|nr:hypothetical protein [Pyrinomonadaceae bacterium]